jgi:enoyl-[acyl-carrier protein] reductase II
VARMGTKLNTPFCTRFGIDVPILVAPFGPWDEAELAVAAASAGCLASLGTAVRSVPELEHQWATLRDRTDRPFVINHTGRPFNPEAFAATLAFKPAAISFHMGIPRDLIDKAHDRGIVWLQTVGDVEGAEAALEAGADVLIAQGTEAGGNGGWIGTLVLVPLIAHTWCPGG